MSSVPRVYVGTDCIDDGIATVSGSDANHILKVLRKQKGDHILICDMHGKQFDSVICDVFENGLRARLGHGVSMDCELPFSVTVYQCMPKGDKLDTVVQKSVELGASEICVVMSERCISRPDVRAFEKRLVRLKKISESAAAQCGRGFVPNVRGVISFDQAISEIAQTKNGFLCYEGEGTKPLRELLAEPKDVAFLIGPEGGISASELQKAASLNIPLAGLGKRILRTETAGTYVLAALSVLFE